MDIRQAQVARRGFNLTELLVVVAIIGILLSISMPAVQGVRENSRRTACAMHLNQIGVALNHYQTVRSEFPIGAIDKDNKDHNWAVALLNYLEKRTVFEKYRYDVKCRAAENREATSVVVDTYLCPSTRRLSTDRDGSLISDRNGNGQYDPGDGMACMDYGGIFGDSRAFRVRGNGMLCWDRAIKLKECRDGLAYTMIVAEITGRGATLGGEWANGDNVFKVSMAINSIGPDQTLDNQIWSDHPGGAYVLTVDMVPHFVRDTADPVVLSALATRAGGEQGKQGETIRVPEN
jgi:prepilin-type N-terminal cleavage/methylation domain-containing protein